MVLYQIDSKNLVEKVTGFADPLEYYYRFIIDGSFAGGLCNKHVILEKRAGKPDDRLVDQEVIKIFKDLVKEKNLDVFSLHNN